GLDTRFCSLQWRSGRVQQTRVSLAEQLLVWILSDGLSVMIGGGTQQLERALWIVGGVGQRFLGDAEGVLPIGILRRIGHCGDGFDRLQVTIPCSAFRQRGVRLEARLRRTTASLARA